MTERPRPKYRLPADAIPPDERAVLDKYSPVDGNAAIAWLLPSERFGVARKPRNGEPDNFIAEYFASASPEELQALDELAELDRRHGNKPTPELRHACSAPRNAAPEKGWGPAIEHCLEDDEGHFSVGNGEYGSYVNFCPFCGVKAPSGIPLKPA